MALTGTGDGTAVRDSAAAYAELVRVPNLFTAPPDVVLGAALAAFAGGGTDVSTVAGLAFASVLLYAAGTTLNDYFDADIDASERPERPIPSGAVSRRAALALGVALIAGGVLVAGLSAALPGALAATAVAVAVVAYDGALKDGPAGFLAMGTARGLNVLLGATAVGALPELASAPVFAALVVTGYIAAVTHMAAGETVGGERWPVAVAAVAAVGAAVSTVLLAFAVGNPGRAAFAGVVGLGFLVWTGRPLRRAYADPAPERVGPAVGACVLGQVVLDGALAAAAGVAPALAALGFLVPAVVLSRSFDVT